MSIGLQRSNSNSIQRSKRMQCVSSIFESPEADVLDSDMRFPAEREKDKDGDSSSSSSLGRNSDGSSDGEDSDELQSSCKGPLDDLDSLEEVLPIKRGISKFYKGKSKSFTSLADASSASSMEDLAKPENPYTRKLLLWSQSFSCIHQNQVFLAFVYGDFTSLLKFTVPVYRASPSCYFFLPPDLVFSFSPCQVEIDGYFYCWWDMGTSNALSISMPS